MDYERRQGFVERGLRKLTPAAPIVGGLTFYVLGYGLGFSGSVMDQAVNLVLNIPHYLVTGQSTEFFKNAVNSLGTSIEQAKYVGNVVSKPMALAGAIGSWKVYRSFVDGLFGRP